MGIPIIGDVIGAVKDIVSEVVVDKDKRNELNVRLQELQDKESERLHDELMAQAEVNKTEAAHPSVFVAGWRPFIGWGCGAAFIYNAIIAPLFHSPVADIAFVQTVLMGMLGIAGMRSYEKVKGVQTDAISVIPKKPESNHTESDAEDKTLNEQSKPPNKYRWSKI